MVGKYKVRERGRVMIIVRTRVWLGLDFGLVLSVAYIIKCV